MSTTQNFIFREGPKFRADFGDYREIKIKGLPDELHSVRIESGRVWDMDHFIPHGLALDGFVFVRKKRILAQLNVDRYDKINFLFSLGEMPDVPDVLPALDHDRQLFEWLRDEGMLVMVFKPEYCGSTMGRVEIVGDKSCMMRLISDELEVSDDVFEFMYNKTHVLVVGTHLLQMFDRYIVETGQV
jgi:hypothetical protein